MNRQYKCFWGSSYDRGLEHLLDIWPEVKKEVPQAELHIYYGWNLFLSAYPDNPERLAWKDKIDQKMKQPGITHHGRVGQRQLREDMKNYGLWTYPTDFDEISCINAMNSQILGVIPVTMKRAALKETVKFGELVPGDINDPKIKKIYTKFLIDWLKDKDKQEKTRKIMMEESKKIFSWRSVAEEWVEEWKKPKVYSTSWAKELWERLPEGLKKDEFKSYRI